MPSKLRPAALVLCGVQQAVGQDKEGPGQQCSQPGLREGLELLTAGGMAGRRTAKAQEEVRPARSLGLSQPFAEFTLYTENRVHCMVLSRGETRLDLHFTAMTPWRIGLKRIYRKDLSH